MQRKCQKDGCNKWARDASNGKQEFCIQHMREFGLTPRIKHCQHEDCTKQVVTSSQGVRLYCIQHMKIYDQEPKVQGCQEPGCGKRAEASKQGLRVYCIIHMRQHGMDPKLQECRQEGCTRQARRSTAGAPQFCREHMRQNGLRPFVPECLMEGCSKWAWSDTSGARLYCRTHMRENGLMPRIQICQHDGCSKQAQSSKQGTPQYCTTHMREHGLEPRIPICQHEGCVKRAEASDTGLRRYCNAHMREMGLAPKVKKCAHEGCRRIALGSTSGPAEYCCTHMKDRGLEPRSYKPTGKRASKRIRLEEGNGLATAGEEVGAGQALGEEPAGSHQRTAEQWLAGGHVAGAEVAAEGPAATSTAAPSAEFGSDVDAPWQWSRQHTDPFQELAAVVVHDQPGLLDHTQPSAPAPRLSTLPSTHAAHLQRVPTASGSSQHTHQVSMGMPPPGSQPGVSFIQGPQIGSQISPQVGGSHQHQQHGAHLHSIPAGLSVSKASHTGAVHLSGASPTMGQTLLHPDAQTSAHSHSHGHAQHRQTKQHSVNPPLPSHHAQQLASSLPRPSEIQNSQALNATMVFPPEDHSHHSLHPVQVSDAQHVIVVPDHHLNQQHVDQHAATRHMLMLLAQQHGLQAPVDAGAQAAGHLDPSMFAPLVMTPAGQLADEAGAVLQQR